MPAFAASPVSARRSRVVQRAPEIVGPVEAVAVVRGSLVELAARDKATFRSAEAWLARRPLPDEAFAVYLFPSEMRPWGVQVKLRRSTPTLCKLVSEMRCFGTAEG